MRKSWCVATGLFIAIVFVVFLVACGEEATTSTAGGTSSTAPSEPTEVLKIGSMVSLSTPQGLEMQKWLNLFAKIKNEAGGWEIGGKKYKVEFVVYDCGIADTTKSRSAYEKAVLQDGIKYIVCTWTDVPSVGVTITEPNKVLWMGTDFSPDTLKPEFKYVIRGQCLSFALGAAYNMQKYYVDKGAKTSVIVDTDTLQAQVGNVNWARAGELAGLKELEPITFPNDTTDFGPVATKVKSLNPDLVELAYVSNSDHLVNIIRALKDVGYDKFIYPGNIDPQLLENIVAQVGKDYVEGWTGMYYDPRGIQKDPKMLALIDRYQQEYGDLRQEGIFWVGPWFLFEEAVNLAQSTDVDAITKCLKSMDHGVATLCGHTQLFARPDVGILDTIDSAPGHYMYEIHDGKMVAKRIVSVKDQYLVSIKALGLVDQFKKYWEEHGKPTFPEEESLFDFSDL
ncbi:MAG: ABC transporter substrate-binding protein [Thermoleophilia bacterium]|nr:ABC transporter substrate-binding protein [Thermoleophilia bacterium]